MYVGENTAVYYIMYLCANAVRIYAVYRFFILFFGKENAKNFRAKIGFGAYYVLNSILFLVSGNPLVSIATNLIPSFLITFFYPSPVLLKVFITGLVYVVNIGVDTIIGTLFFPTDNYFLTTGFATAVGVLLIEFLLEYVYRFQKEYKLELRGKERILLIVPFISIMLAAANYICEFGSTMTAVNLIGLFVINFSFFLLYSYLIKQKRANYEARILREQLAAFHAEFEAMELSARQTRLIRHDIKNHLASVFSYIESGDTDKAMVYIRELNENVMLKGKVVSTGNFDMNCILNYHIVKAEAEGVMLNTDIQVPDQWSITPFSLNVILGNLLDNAVEAASKCSQKQVQCQIRYRIGKLLIRIKNPYTGTREKEGSTYRTTKADGSNHGYGLESVRNEVQKYQGEVMIEDKNQQFCVDVILFIDE